MTEATPDPSIEAASGRLLSSGEKDKLIAYHEAGHAVVGLAFGFDIKSVTIVADDDDDAARSAIRL